MALIEKLNAIGDAIRAKTGGKAKLSLTDMATAIAGIQAGGGGGSTIIGTFTPTSADNASGKSIQVTVSKFPRCVCVFDTNISTAVDRYAIQFLTIWNPADSMANNQNVWVSSRYKSSTSSGTTFTQAGAYAATAWNSSYTATNASSYQYACTVTSSKVYFKTNGNYRFRADATYRYMIFFD